MFQLLETPGLLDDNKSPQEVTQLVDTAMEYLSPGPHVILYVTSSLAWGSQWEYEAFQRLNVYLGEQFTRHALVIVTHGDHVTVTSDDLRYINRYAHERLRNVVRECGDRCVVFNNMAGGENQQQVERLVRAVRSLYDDLNVLYQHPASQLALTTHRSASTRPRPLRDMSDASKREWEARIRHIMEDAYNRLRRQEDKGRKAGARERIRSDSAAEGETERGVKDGNRGRTTSAPGPGRGQVGAGRGRGQVGAGRGRVQVGAGRGGDARLAELEESNEHKLQFLDKLRARQVSRDSCMLM
nr:hypothetical protein BaRGS_019358 [Batillaria attramentaria]